MLSNMHDTGAEKMIGKAGREAVERALSENELHSAFHQVQRQGALTDTSGESEPLLALLSALGTRRADAHAYVLDRARNELLRLIPELPQEALSELVQGSFQFVDEDELRDIPVVALSYMRDVPSKYLQKLAQSEQVFHSLPAAVKRKVWSNDPSLLCTHASDAPVHYSCESAPMQRLLSMDVVLERAAPHTGEDDSMQPLHHLPSDPAASHRFSRKQLRASGTVRRLCRLVNTESELLHILTSFFRRRYSQLGDQCLCSLRSQLVMGLNDDASTLPVARSDAQHTIIWRLSACEHDGYVDSRTMANVDKQLSKLVDAIRNMIKVKKLTVKGSKPKHEQPRDSQEDAPEEQPSQQQKHEQQASRGSISSLSRGMMRALDGAADGAMVIRDPPVLHLLLHESIRRLEYLTKVEADVSKDVHLQRLLKAMWFGLQARTFARNALDEIELTVDWKRLNTSLSTLKAYMKEEPCGTSAAWDSAQNDGTALHRESETSNADTPQPGTADDAANTPKAKKAQQEGNEQESEEEEGEISEDDEEMKAGKADGEATEDETPIKQSHQKTDGASVQPLELDEMSKLLHNSRLERKLVLTYLLSKLALEQHNAALPILDLVAHTARSQASRPDEQGEFQLADCQDEPQTAVQAPNELHSETAFSCTLARRLGLLMSRKSISSKGRVWELGMRKFLMPACNSSVMTHYEVVQALSTAAQGMPIDMLACDVTALLNTTEQQRSSLLQQQAKKQQQQQQQNQQYAYDPEQHKLSTTPAVAESDSQLSGRGAEQVVSAYMSLGAKNKRLNEERVPLLHEFIRSAKKAQ